MSLEAGAGAPLARYAAWRRAGDFIFLSGIIPVNPLTGTIVNGFQDVPEPVRELLERTKHERPQVWHELLSEIKNALKSRRQMTQAEIFDRL